MRKYVHDTARRWKEFQSSHPAVAGEIRGLILGICGDMTAAGRKRSISAMRASDEFEKLRTIALPYAAALGIRENTEREFALWIRTICFWDVMRQEHAA